MNDFDTFTIKLPKSLGDLGKLIVADSFEWFPKVQKIAQSGHTAGVINLSSLNIRIKNFSANVQSTNLQQCFIL